MTTLLSLLVAISGLGENPPCDVNHPAGVALVLAAHLGMPPECVRDVFGEPDGSITGRVDWRTNPDRYLFWDYTRYGVWVEWEESPFPCTGRGPGIVKQGNTTSWGSASRKDGHSGKWSLRE